MLKSTSLYRTGAANMPKFRSVWVPCSVSRGMFPGEYAVEISFGPDQAFSLFVQKLDPQEIDLDKATAQLRVQLPQEQVAGDYLFLYLPQETLQTGKRLVRVPSSYVAQTQRS